MSEPSAHRQAAQEAAAAGAGALLGLALGDATGAVAGAAVVPAIEPFMARVWDELRGDGQARAEEVMRTAAASLGDGAVDFEQRVRRTEQTRLMAATAMDAGMRTAWRPKARALGRALAAGLADGARADEEQLIIGALADIEVLHARVLSLLVTKKWTYGYDSPASSQGGWAVRDLLAQERPPKRYPEWTSEQIGTALADLSAVVPSILGTLQRHGLIAPRYDLSDALGSLVTDKGDGTYEIDTTAGPDEPTITWSATALGLQLHEFLMSSIDDIGPNSTPFAG